MDIHQRPDGTRMQAGLGMPQATRPAARARPGPVDATIIAVYPKDDPKNPFPILTVDVQTQVSGVGQGVHSRVPVYGADPFSSSSIAPGLPCLVWFKENRACSPFIFGFGAFDGDNASPTLPGEKRDYHQSGAMDRTACDGTKMSIAKNSNETLVEDVDPSVEQATGGIKLSEFGLHMLKIFEGSKLKVYPDAGKLAVGYGHQVLPEDQLALGDEIDVPRQDAFLVQDVAKAESIVASAGASIGRDLSTLAQHQKDALISLAYNAPSAFTQQSDMLEALAEHRDADVPEGMTHIRISDGKVNPDLVARRAKEGVLFATGVYP